MRMRTARKNVPLSTTTTKDAYVDQIAFYASMGNFTNTSTSLRGERDTVSTRSILG